jgi:hypothetical protein
MILRLFVLIPLLLAIPATMVTSAAAPESRMVAQADLEDRPAGQEPAAAPAEGETGEVDFFGAFVNGMRAAFTSMLFWLTIIGTLVFVYIVALIIAHSGYQTGNPLSALSSSRTGVGVGLLSAFIVPALLWWWQGLPWLWALFISLCLMLLGVIQLVSRAH